MLSTPRKIVLGLSLLLLSAGAAVFLARWIPLETMQGWAAKVRGSNDLSPERYGRFRHLCLLYGGGSVLYGLAGLIWSRGTTEFAAQLWTRAPGDPAARPDPEHDPLAFPGEWFLFGAIFLIGAGLRGALLNQPMAYDEAYSYRSFARHSLPEALGELNSANNHLLNTLGMWITSRLFGPEEWALRLPVFTCGLALLPAVFLWVRRQAGGAAGLLASAVVAVSPLMISYSTDARGYMSVALAAVVFDGALRFLDGAPRPERTVFAWIAAWGAVVFGLWGMILMAFPIVGGTLWYVLVPIIRGDPASGRAAAGRLRQMTVLGALTLLPAVAIYAPGYIVRGLQLFQDPVIHKVDQSGLWGVVQDWLGAWRWWTEGFFPPIVWIGACLLGVVALLQRWAEVLRWTAPFLMMLGVNAARGLHPPPRTFLWLMPWVAVLAARGFCPPGWLAANSIFRERRGRWGLTRSQLVAAGVAVGVLGGGLFHVASSWPVIFNPAERRDYVSLPELIAHLAEESRKQAGTPQRLIAPLPCDLPSLFYMSRAGIELPVNGEPQVGERVWLIARAGTTPAATLGDNLVQLSQAEEQFEAWELVWHFETLDLYRSRLR